MNIPNLLTVARFLLIPILLIALLTDMFFLAVGIYVLASITDVLDGFIARKYNLITNFGKVLDPMADKLLQFSALIGLYLKSIIPLWIVIVFFVKEAVIGLGCVRLLKKDIVPQAKWFGKMSTCIFFLAIVVSMLSKYFTSLEGYPVVLMSFALIMTFFSLAMYIIRFNKSLKN